MPPPPPPQLPSGSILVPRPSRSCGRRHNYLHLLAILVASMMFNVTMLFTSGALGHRLGLFVHTPGGFAEKFYLEKYKLEVTPADWVFYMSAVIYVWQALWLTYGVVNVFRKTSSRDYVYLAFPVLPPILYVVFAFSLACNINWLLIWERQYMEVALLFVNLMSCTLYVCLVVCLRRLDQFCRQFGNSFSSSSVSFSPSAAAVAGSVSVVPTLASGSTAPAAAAAQAAPVDPDFRRDVWMVRLVVQNGLAMFAMWGTVASMFNFAVVLTYRTGARQSVSSSVALSIFTLEIVTWWIFDNFVFEKYFRFLLTPYVVLIMSIAGITSKNWDPTNGNAVYTLVLFCLVVLLTIAKVALLVWRQKNRPLYGATVVVVGGGGGGGQDRNCVMVTSVAAAAAASGAACEGHGLLKASNS